MNKKFFSVLIAMLFVFSAVCGAFAQDVSVPEEYRGVWVCGRAELRMIRADSGYIALIHWASSYAEHSSWVYTLTYDPANDCLTDAGTGVRGTTLFSDDGTESTYTEEYKDGTASFRLNDTGKLLWEDAAEDAGRDMEFEKVDFVGIYPTQEDFADGYFRVIGGYHPGTAGSSLGQAQAAYKAYLFAMTHQVWNADIPTLRADMLAAWEGLTDQERADFDANFISVVRLISDCMDNWDAHKGVFADAGVDADRMGELLKDIEAREAWSTLVSHTLTMGNLDN